ncbi:Metallothionein-like protein 4A [Nymphaea thermarum]|nr:Metallothionein-like protein 4A [Nymphaea thermarum]
MSCCGGNCGCGSGCGCGKGCGGCKMFPDLSFSGEKNMEISIVGIAPEAKHFEDMEMVGYENDGCKCGANCSCGSSCNI